MPYYEVEHSYPLTQPQKQSIASTITQLHSTTFLTPSHFVHVSFRAHNASEGNYFLAGKPRTSSTNRILAMVRTGSSRSKKDFDELAEKIENAWMEVISGKLIEEGKDKGKRELDVGKGEVEIKAKRLLVVAFYAMVGVRENGHVIPAAGEEAQWYKEMKPEFQRLADTGEEEYQALIKEVETREDLKKAYLGGSSWFGSS